jgi:hypothetical protein
MINVIITDTTYVNHLFLLKYIETFSAKFLFAKAFRGSKNIFIIFFIMIPSFHEHIDVFHQFVAIIDF